MSTIQEFIKQRPYLIWYVKDLEKLNEESIVEHVLNYGDMDDVKKMISILGVKRVARIFRKYSQKKGEIRRVNYRPEIINYFNLFFKKNA